MTIGLGELKDSLYYLVQDSDIHCLTTKSVPMIKCGDDYICYDHYPSIIMNKDLRRTRLVSEAT